MNHNNLHPIFQGILDDFTAGPFREQIAKAGRVAVCYYCEHVIDLTADTYERIDTLQSVLKGEERGYVHELCAAEMDAEIMKDAGRDRMSEYADHDFYNAFGEEL